MLQGKCTCGEVRFGVADEFAYAGYCHCSQCRAASGSAFSAFGGIEKAKLEITNGPHNIAIYVKSPDNIRNFCKLCGSPLFAIVRESRYAHVQLGTLIDAPSIRPMFHIFVGSKAPWHQIADNLPQFDEYAPLTPKAG